MESRRFFLTGTCPASPAMEAGLMGQIKSEISLARVLLATACPGSPALWAGSFNSGHESIRYHSYPVGIEKRHEAIASGYENGLLR